MSEIVDVVVVGFGAGVGLTVVFALLIAEAARSATARRDGRGGVALAHGLAAGAAGLVCAVAVVLGVVAMLSR